jgi:hypothetical protein
MYALNQLDFGVALEGSTVTPALRPCSASRWSIAASVSRP